MQGLKKDTLFVTLLLVINTVIQVMNTNTASSMVRYLYIFMLIVAMVSTVALIKNQSTTKVLYGILIYISTFAIITIVMGFVNEINIFDTVYGVIWCTTIYSYITCLSHPVLSMVSLASSQIFTIVTQLAGGISLEESFNSVAGLLLINIVALGIYIYQAKKNGAKGIKNLIFFEREPIKLKLWVQIVIWSLMISSVAHIAKTQIYEVMNSEIKYAVMASVSITITTFLMLSAITASALIIEVFGVYIVFEIYTLSHLVFIQDNNLFEIATVLIDIAIIIYMISKYKMLKIAKSKSKEQNK